jgi:hypothetical protein
MLAGGRRPSGSLPAVPLHPHELSYPTLALDTTPEAEAARFEILRKMSAHQKLAQVEAAIATGRALALAGLRKRYPAATEAELQRRLFGLLLGEELATTVYGPLPGEPDDCSNRARQASSSAPAHLFS